MPGEGVEGLPSAMWCLWWAGAMLGWAISYCGQTSHGQCMGNFASSYGAGFVCSRVENVLKDVLHWQCVGCLWNAQPPETGRKRSAALEAATMAYPGFIFQPS